MMQRASLFCTISATVSLLGFMPAPCAGQTSVLPSVAPVPSPCQRPAAGSVVANPPSLFSVNDVLAVRFSYQHATDSAGRELFCFMTPDGLQNPTLHVRPGDHLVITVTNNLPLGTGSPKPSRSKGRTTRSPLVAPGTTRL